jgi:hypothetical protein
MRRGRYGSGRLQAASNSPSASSRALERLDDELQHAAGGVDVDPAANADLHALLRLDLEPEGPAAEQDRTQQCTLVLQIEVDVSQARAVERADLALDPDVAEALLELPAELGDELRHLKDDSLLEREQAPGHASERSTPSPAGRPAPPAVTPQEAA